MNTSDIWVYTDAFGFLNLSRFAMITPHNGGETASLNAGDAGSIILAGRDATAVLNCMAFFISEGQVESFADLIEAFNDEDEEETEGE